MPARPILSFAQAQGFEALPEQAKLGTISRGTSAGLWRIIYEDLTAASGNSRYPLARTRIHLVLIDWWVEAQEQMAHLAPTLKSEWVKVLTPHFSEGFPYAYNIAQYLLEHPECAGHWLTGFSEVLISTRAAYRVLGDKIVPFGSEEEMAQLSAAIAAAEGASAPGSKAHLLAAAKEMNIGNWAGSVHEAVSAVEAAARITTGEHGKGLSELLVEMRKSGRIQHPALAGALIKLYAYTSDQKGIRHSLVLDGQASVSEREAFLMLGLCSAMTTYLLNL